MMNWDIAPWFVALNSWVAGAVRVQTLEHRPRRVTEAARANRFVWCGW
jgi:hypothetical protein